MQYAYQALNGDGTIVARITSLDNTSPAAQAGVTIRESTGSNSNHVTLTVTYSNGPEFLARSNNGNTTLSGSAGPFTPTWVKLVRAGATFTGYVSADGLAWTLLGTATVSMGNSVTIGLLTSSNNVRALNVATMTNVNVTGNLGTPSPSYNNLAGPTGLNVGLATGTGLRLSWNSVAGATGYAVDRSGDGITFKPAIASTA